MGTVMKFNLILILSSCRLSGESPFQGESDTETLALVTAAKWEFDEESFEDITDLAKDFISSLLSKDVRCFIILHVPYTHHHTDASIQIHNCALNPLTGVGCHVKMPWLMTGWHVRV